MTAEPLGFIIEDFLDHPPEARKLGVYLFNDYDHHVCDDILAEGYTYEVLRDAEPGYPGRMAVEVIGLETGEVFSATHASVSTYVRRKTKRGRTYDGLLSYSIHHPGRHFLIYGPSKIGKTQLWRAVLGSDGIAVPCTGAEDVGNLYALALYRLARPYVSSESETNSTTLREERSAELSMGSSVGPQLTAGGADCTEEMLAREMKHAYETRPHSAVAVADEFSKSGNVLILENFHRIKPDDLQQLSLDLRTFSDGGVSVLLVGIPDDPYEISNRNPELSGRVDFLHLPPWTTTELRAIAERGEKALNIEFTDEALNLLAEEAAGSPLLMQQLSHVACLAAEVPHRCDTTQEIHVNLRRLRSGVQTMLGPSLAPYSQFRTILSEHADAANLPMDFPDRLVALVQRRRGSMMFGFGDLGMITTEDESLQEFSRRTREDNRTSGRLRINLVKRNVVINDPFWYAYMRWIETEEEAD
jgi:hypothetical protein